MLRNWERGRQWKLFGMIGYMSFLKKYEKIGSWPETITESRLGRQQND